MPIDSRNGSDDSSISVVSLLSASGQAAGPPTSVQEQEQLRQLNLLDANQAALTRLFAGLPTFDTVLKDLLVKAIKATIPTHKFRSSLLERIDPDHWYVNHYATDSNGERSLTASKSFSEVMWDGVSTDSPPAYTLGEVGFFTRPDEVDETHSVFAVPVDMPMLRAMESALHIANPPTNDHVSRQFRAGLAHFRHPVNDGDWLGSTTLKTVEAAFAHLLSQRFLHFLDLYKADRDPAAKSVQGLRTLHGDEDRLLDLITTHPAKADRNRLMRAPIPQVYAVMLDMGVDTPQQWPGAMVIKRADQQMLFLYSLERGLQRFGSFQQLVARVLPVYKDQQRKVLDISTERTGHVFAVAAQELLDLQSAALETALNAPENETVAVRTFARNVEDALVLPTLSLVEPLIFRVATQIENNRPDFYKTATPLEQAHYRRLEGKTLNAAYRLGDGIETLEQFARRKIKQYLQQTVHTNIHPDPDKTMITFFSGKTVDPRNSRITSLTQLMLDNVRPHQYPNTLREILTVYLVDRHGQRIRHPATGFPITLAGDELARMATTLDVGGSYETLIREVLNKPAYKAAWQVAYLANMKLKGYEATLKGSEVFRTEVVDDSRKPAKSKKRLALWLRAIAQSPTAEGRAEVGGRHVNVYGLLLGGSVGIGGQNGTMGDAVSIEGALIVTDQDGPVIKGTVAVYFPDSPQGNDLHEFSDLSDGVAALLRQEEWRTYFRSRISSADQEEIKKMLGQHRSRPLIRGMLITGDFLETFHQAHVNFHSAYADHRSTSNRDMQRQAALRIGMAVVESMMDLVGLLFTPGFRLLSSAVEVGYSAFRTGIPMDLKTLIHVHNLSSRINQRSVHGWVLPLKGQASPVTAAARQSQREAPAGLPLEETLYRRYAVTDPALIQGASPDAQGFYRPSITDNATGSVSRRVYVRQPDGTVFRVHDHTRLNASEATLVDPMTGLSIRSSGVMRSTVAQMPDGEWRAVGFGQGGGKRRAGSSPGPGPSDPKVPALTSISDVIRTPGSWDNEIMDLVPAIMTRLGSWPSNRSLLIRDEIARNNQWSVRFTPGENERIYPLRHHPDQLPNDVVLSRVRTNHYRLILNDRTVDIPADGDCFFNAIAQGLNEGQAQGRFTMRGLRNEAARYIDQHPELAHYLPAQQGSGMQLALFHNAAPLKDLLGTAAFRDLTQIIDGGPNPHQLFQPALNYLSSAINSAGRRVLNRAQSGVLPAEIYQQIGRYLSVRAAGPLRRWYGPLTSRERQSLHDFLKNVLLAPVQHRYIVQLIEEDHFLLSHDQIHILLEYGVTARELVFNHRVADDAFVLFDQETHGHLDEDELEELLDGVSLVTSDELEELAQRIRQTTGRVIDDQAELLNAFIDHTNADNTRSLYRQALSRFPALQRRAEILLGSPIVAWTLGDKLSVSLFAEWLRDTTLSNVRLRLIAEYANSRYSELLNTTDLDIDWMRPFNDRNLGSIIARRTELEAFRIFLGNEQEVGDEPAWVLNFFSALGQRASNARISLLFDTPGLWSSLQRFSLDSARQIWEDLIGPHFSDTHIRLALGQPGVLSSELHFALALETSLTSEEVRANRIIRGLFSLGQRRAQQYLYNFDFPTNRLGHSRLDFALHLENHMRMPDWAWQYVRDGVSADSLKLFGDPKAPKPDANKPAD
ncbi:OTU domain-containing protein [Pseudomonas sp. R3-41]